MSESLEISRRKLLEMAAAVTAGTRSSFGQALSGQEFGVPAENVTVLRGKNPKGGSWPEVVAAALAQPLGRPRLREHNLRRKRVVVITDDWGRPTPASEVIPALLDELHAAGAEDQAITFITASGMHDPMKPADLDRKLGKDITQRFRCISHNGGDQSMLVFAGISELGTPVWVSRYVAEADFKVALGRIALHETYGYEGGYKMIVPGVSSYETILRDHSMNFSRHCVPGVHANPSRREADAIGPMIGIDFLVNVVVNSRSEPVRAFAGKVEQVHPAGVRFGDQEIWGAFTPWRSDVTVVTLGPDESLRDVPNTETMRRAAAVTRDKGTIIFEANVEKVYQPMIGNETADEETLNSKDVASFNAMLPRLSLSELMFIHEKRDWKLDRRTIQHRVKAVRGAFYRLRALMEAQKCQLLLSPDPARTLKEATRELPAGQFKLNVIVGRATLPKIRGQAVS